MAFNPSVNITVNETLSLLPGQEDTVIMIVGTAQYGPIDSVQTFSSFANILDTYKEDVDSNSTIIKAADLAYANGASTVKVLRIEDGDAASSAVALDGNSGGEAGVLTFTATYKGVYGNNFYVDVDTQGTGRTLTIRNGDYVEVFDNNGNANGYATNAAIATAINDSASGSALVSVTVKSGSETSNLVDATGSEQQLTSGDDGSDSLSASDYTTAFDSFLATEDWDLLVIPDSDNSDLENGDSFHSSILTKVNSRATNNKKYGMFISGVDKDEAQATIQARTTQGSRFVLCAPNITTTSRITGLSTIYDGTYLAAAVAGMIAGREVHEAITRKVIGVSDLSINESSGTKYYTLAQTESLLGSGVCVASKLGGGIKVARGVTRASDTSSIYYEINIQRIVDDIRGDVLDLLDGFLGDPNIARIRSMIGSEIDGLLSEKQRNENIVAFTATQVDEGSSSDTINVTVAVQPTFAVNFINVVISVSQV